MTARAFRTSDLERAIAAAKRAREPQRRIMEAGK